MNGRIVLGLVPINHGDGPRNARPEVLGSDRMANDLQTSVTVLKRFQRRVWLRAGRTTLDRLITRTGQKTQLTKISIAALLAFGISGLGAAQGAGLLFQNFGGGVNAPVFNAAGDPIAAPCPFVADLFWSLNTNAPMDSLAPAGDITPFAAPQPYGSGYFFGGWVDFLPVGLILAQVRAWDTNYGATYYEARDNGGEFGFSNLILAFSFQEGNSLAGLQSFRLQRLPRLSLSLTTTNTLLFSWPAEVTTYVLQQNDGFNAANWTTLTNTPVVVESQNKLMIPIPQGNVFYRLISKSQ